MTRDERQKLCIKNWLKNGLKGTVVGATGMGKTRVALKSLNLLHKHYPDYRFIVVVPTTNLKDQWEAQLPDWEIEMCTEVVVINTGIKHYWHCDVLVVDEIHTLGADTFQHIFDCISYKYILGLTATYERLDGKEILISKYCPVIDTVSVQECLKNGWIAPYKEYEVLIDVPDIDVYKGYNKQFVAAFEYFGYDFKKAQSCMQDWRNKITVRDEKAPNGASKEELSNILKTVTIMTAQFSRSMQARKKFINNHPEKIRIAKKIIEMRPNSKIITFSNSISMAEQIQDGKNVYTGKQTKKKGRTTIEEFNKCTSGCINSVMKLIAGADLKGLNTEIVLGIDSSKLKAVQRLGRVVRFEPGKVAEVFTIVINNTQETKWYRDSHPDGNYTIIDEKGLDDVLNGRTPQPYTKPIQKLTFRF